MYHVITDPHERVFSFTTLNTIFSHFIVGVVIVVAVIPEGLPLAVMLSLSYAVEKMKVQNNLVRDLASSETMGNVTDICSDKTGTLTQNQMTTEAIFMEDTLILPVLSELRKSKTLPSISKSGMQLLLTCVQANSTATPEFFDDDRRKPLQFGNKTECALL
jgi:magnesium-transporting ATPase (P-type)